MVGMRTCPTPSTKQRFLFRDLLKTALNLHQSRAKALLLFVVAVIKTRTVNLVEVAVFMKTSATTDSNYKRLQWFLKGVSIDPDDFARLMERLIPVAGKWVLTLDRTHWKFGKANINILLLGVACDGASYPLMCRLLPKQRNSNTRKRIELMSRFLTVFGTEKVETLTADREFIGKDWFQWLHQHKVPFVIRIRENFSVTP